MRPSSVVESMDKVPGADITEICCLRAAKDCTRSTEAEPGMEQQRAAEAEGHEYTEDNEQFDDV